MRVASARAPARACACARAALRLRAGRTRPAIILAGALGLAALSTGLAVYAPRVLIRGAGGSSYTGTLAMLAGAALTLLAFRVALRGVRAVAPLGARVSTASGPSGASRTICVSRTRGVVMLAVGVQERLVEVAAGEGGEPAVREPAGEEKTFRPYDPEQVLLLAPVLSEWVPEGDLAHFVSDLVESGALDLSAIYAGYEEERGFPPYDPRLMVKLLVYGYANGVCSSRKLERASYRDVAVWMLCADQHPDYRSIARFRARHLEALGDLFVQALRLCRRAKLVGLGTLALDGTKLRANASRHKAMSFERMVRAETQLEAEVSVLRANVRALLEEAEAVDAEEDERYGPDRRGDELPAELQRREQRLAVIREAKQALEAEAAEREAARRASSRRRGRSLAGRRTDATRSSRSRARSATSPIPSRSS
jgi:transposase